MVTPESNLLDRVLASVAGCLTLGSAQRLAELKIDPEMQSTINQLADKANHGLLTHADRAEHRYFVESLDLIGILQSTAQARRATI